MTPLALSPSAPAWGGDLGYRVTIGGFFELHILIAGLVSAAGQIGPFCEWLGWVRRDSRYDRLARAQAKFIIYYFAISSAVAFLLIAVLLVALFGRFWSVLVRAMLWPFWIELLAFVAEVTLSYLWYYTWARMTGRLKAPHMALGGLLAVASFTQVWMINIVAAYMLTPAPLSDPVHVFFNPTVYPLQLHRIVGNLAYIGFATAGLSSILYLRTREPARRAFLDWSGGWGLTLGVVMTLLQPMVGYSYAKEIQLHAYSAWYKMMYGSLSGVFLWQITLLGVIFLVAAAYFARRVRRDQAPGGWSLTLIAGALVPATLLAAVPYHLSLTFDDVLAAGRDRPLWQGGLIIPLGAMFPWKILALSFYTLLAAAAALFFVRAMSHLRWGGAGRREQHLLLASTVLAVAMMITMGVIRENGREPYLIDGQMQVQDQAPAPEQSAPVSPP